MKETAQEAARAFAVLQGLDLHNAERQELQASGVPEHRIQSLYGRGWATLVPGIIEHLRGIQDEDLLLEGCIEKEQAYNLSNSLAGAIFAALEADDDVDDDELRALGMENELVDYIVERFGNSKPKTMMAVSNLTPYTVTASIWTANWLMAHRSQFSPKKRQQTDELMVAIARTIAL